jgi:maltose alpha-D-glucosyltransferase / alpha-amylase
MWYKTAIIYELDVKVFYDSTGNGIGDIQGVISKLDYIDSMGFNCIWLLPFYPSPKKDNGYDVKDYYNVDPELGDLGDFAQLVNECDKRGIRIIIDLVVNHTSIEHPWFLDSQSSRKSKYRDYYIWQDNPDKDKEEVMLEGVNETVWEYSRKTRSYYLHKYFKYQADLNMANPGVIKEILKIMEFWLKLGVSGFRIDAAHVITDPVDVDHIDFGNLHSLFEKMNDLIREKRPSAVLLGEASVPPEETREYFLSDNGNPRLHMLFNFISNKHTFLAFARKKGKTLNQALEIYNDIEPAHWVNFVRHHDELNLELLSNSERKEVWAAFAPEENMRIFGHGIRRRLPPMLGNDERRIKLFYTVIFGLPGIPLINYGEEIAMGDDLGLDGRNSVRTPMQWTAEENGGFSKAPKQKLYRPVIRDGEFSYKKLNVLDQQYHPQSFLNFICHLIRIRRQVPAIGRGTLHILEPDDERVAAWCFEYDNTVLMTVFNLSDDEVLTRIDTGITPAKIMPAFEDSIYDDDAGPDNLYLKPYGYRWIQIKKEVQPVSR